MAMQFIKVTPALGYPPIWINAAMIERIEPANHEAVGEHAVIQFSSGERLAVEETAIKVIGKMGGTSQTEL